MRRRWPCSSASWRAGTRQGERPRVEVVGVSGSWQNLAMARGLEATNGYNPLRIGSYDRLVSPGETTHIVDQRLFPASFDGYDCALARELGLEYLVLGRPIEEVPHLTRRPVSDVLLAGPKVWIYRLAAGRAARQVHQARGGGGRGRPGQGGTVYDQPGRRDGADRRRDGARRTSTGRRAAAGDRGWADILSWGPDRLEIEVESDQPGIVMAHDDATIPAGSPRSMASPRACCGPMSCSAASR